MINYLNKSVLFCILFLVIGYILDINSIINTVFFVGVGLKIIFLLKNRVNLETVNYQSMDKRLPLIALIFCVMLFIISLYAYDVKISIKFAEHYFKWMIIPFGMIWILAFGIKQFEKYIVYGLAITSMLIALDLLRKSIFLGVLRPADFLIGNPNSAAGILILILPFVILNKSITNKILKISIISILSCALLVTESRGAIIAYFIMMMFLLILLWIKYRCVVKCSDILKYSCIIVLIVVLILGNTEIKDNLSNRFNEGIKFHDSLQENRVGGDRILLWTSSIDMIKDHPIFGVGLRNFNKVYNEGGYINKNAREPELTSPHNIFLHFFVETGLLGGIAFCSLIFYQLYYTWKNSKNDRFVLAYFLAILCMCIHGMVDYIFTIKVYYQLYWLLCGAVWLHIFMKNSDVKNI